MKSALQPLKYAFLGMGFALLAGCAAQPAGDTIDAPGFFMGLFHGFFALISLIGSIILPVYVYAVPNSGFWYDAGFLLGFALSLLTIVLALLPRIGGYFS
ncbi:MAG TPA: hypothetical protein VFI93_01250 [Rhizomicrobium sp.]|jgi:hypothetical protein|nr:hypothetical protein [Rhizomicrobium sp.]